MQLIWSWIQWSVALEHQTAPATLRLRVASAENALSFTICYQSYHRGERDPNRASRLSLIPIDTHREGAQI